MASVPIHLLSVLYAPKAGVASLNRLMSNFFWGFYNGKPKKKWVSWARVCTPILEGGMGLRNFEDVQVLLFMKFAWKLLTQNSIWVNFFKEKYVKETYLFD